MSRPDVETIRGSSSASAARYPSDGPTATHSASRGNDGQSKRPTTSSDSNARRSRATPLASRSAPAIWPPFQVGHEPAERGRVGRAVEAAHRDVHRMHRPAAEQLQESAADLLQPQAALHEARQPGRNLEAALQAEVVGRVQEEDVDGMALDPFRGEQQPPQEPQLGRDADAERGLQGAAGRELIGHRADAADPRHDVGNLADRAADEQPLEEPWRLEDRESGDLDGAIGSDADMQAPGAFDPGQGPDVDSPDGR